MRPTKRFFDLFLTGFGLLVLWPGLLLIGLIVKFSDGGPMFFRQHRVGRFGEPFQMWKFRTMRVDAGGEPITLHEDPRVTSVGKLLRAFRLDELPQLFNVVAGDMSLVGPRPDVPKYVALYTEQQRRVLELTPGITDPAVFTVMDYRKQHADAKDLEHVYINKILPEKVRISIEYETRATWWTDLQVIMKTLRALFR